MLAFERAAPRFDGVVTLSRPAGAALANGKAGASEQPWRLSSKIKADATAAALDEVSFQYGPDERAVTLAGSAALKFGERPLLQGRLAARQVDFDRLLATSDAPRRLPLAAVQAFGEMLGSAMRPSWPVALSIGVDAATLGGATLQGIAGDLRSDGATWTLDKLELRAPGFSQVKLSGTLYAAGRGLGFSGGANIDSNDPKNLLAWLTGSGAAAAQIARWHAEGDITLAPDRIAVEGLKTEFQRGAVEGSLAYAWPTGNRPARLKADLRAAELDLDALFGMGRTAVSGLGLELPRELELALEIGRARVAGLQARDATARLSLDADGLAIERLSIADLGDASVEASGRIRNLAAPGGSVTVDLDARDLKGIVALSEKFIPPLAEPLRRLAGGQRTATLRATIGLGNNGADDANGTLGLTGKVGAVRVNASARASGKREAFTLANLHALADADIRFDSLLEADEAGPLLALVGLDRIAVAGKRPARLSLSANGPLAGDLRFEGKFDAGPVDAVGKGAFRRPADQPATLDLEQVAGTIGGNKVKAGWHCGLAIRRTSMARSKRRRSTRRRRSRRRSACQCSTTRVRRPAGRASRLPGMRPAWPVASHSRRSARCSRPKSWRST
jgi:large subunit ribosomal protein L24